MAKGHHGGHHGGRKGGGHKHKALADLLQPGKTQSGKSLLRLAQAMTRLQTKPQVHAYQRLANELRGQEAADVGGTARLGRVLGRNVAGAYRGFDAGANQATMNAAALGRMGTNAAGQIGQQQADELQQFQTGQLGGYQEAMALRGAPGGGLAQQQLRDLVAGQQQRMTSQAQGNTAFASAQGNAYTGLAQGIQQAGRIQGAAAQSDLQRTIASQMADIRLKSGADIREALGKKADVKALKGSQLIATLGQLTKDERDFILGLKATKVDKFAAQASAASAAASDAETHRHNLQTEANTRRGQNMSSSGGGNNSGRTARRRRVKDAYGRISGYINEHGAPPTKKDAAYMLNHLPGGYNYNIYQAAWRKYIKKHPHVKPRHKQK